MSISKQGIPPWADAVLLPLINLSLALLATGLVVLFIGESPMEVVEVLLVGAFGSEEAIGYTLYYTTNLTFTALAVALAFHAALFNIGGEGQAYFAGLGVGLVALAFDSLLPGWILIPLMTIAALAFGAFWGFIPGYLQAKRGSHVVITTIMFNFIASALLVYMLVNVIIAPGQMSPETRAFLPSTWIPFMHEAAAGLGIEITHTPLNLTFFLAITCALLFWGYVWHTRWGYELRSVGANARAATYGGISPPKVIIITMSLSGALAGLVAVNEIAGVHHRLLVNFSFGYGFTGIAVALMGRNHPVGILMAAVLFGALYQGGAELAFEFSSITTEMVIVIQGLVILFTGALEFMLWPTVARLFRKPSLQAAG